MSNPVGIIRQAAAIPVADNLVCVITSRNGKRWVIPKGCIDPGMSAPETALQESWEEAGLAGTLQPDPVGSFIYDKDGFTHHVVVYVLDVHGVHDAWPEDHFRQREWVTPKEAIDRIDDPGLRKILRGVLPLRRAN